MGNAKGACVHAPGGPGQVFESRRGRWCSSAARFLYQVGGACGGGVGCARPPVPPRSVISSAALSVHAGRDDDVRTAAAAAGGATRRPSSTCTRRRSQRSSSSASLAARTCRPAAAP